MIKASTELRQAYAKAPMPQPEGGFEAPARAARNIARGTGYRFSERCH